MNVVHLVFFLASYRCFVVKGTPVNPGEYYEILELNSDATDDLIKRNYRRLAMQWHPDKHEENKEKAAEVFQKIREAYDVLSDPTKRMEYDKNMLKGESYHESRNVSTIRRENYNKNKREPRGVGSIVQLDESLTLIFNTKTSNMKTNIPLGYHGKDLFNHSTSYVDEEKSRSNNQRPNTPESCDYITHGKWKTRVITAQSLVDGTKSTITIMEMPLKDGKVQVVTVEEIVDSNGIKHVRRNVEVKNLRGSQNFRGELNAQPQSTPLIDGSSASPLSQSTS